VSNLSRRAFIQHLLFGSAAFLGGRVAGDVYHAEVTQHRVVLPRLRRGLRVVQLSDLHFGPYLHAGSVRAWVAQAQAQRGDLIVLTGDTVDRWLRAPLDGLVEALSGLHAPLGVWACAGNHDRVRFPDLEPLKTALTEAGITLLVNEGRALRPDLYLGAVDDWEMGSPDLTAAMIDAPAGAATLLLCHQPDFLPEMTLPVDLTLVGHTHGGQVRLPFWGVLRSSSRYGERYLEGWVQPPDARFDRAYVSRGLGVSLLPLRWNCPAELAVFDLVPGQRS
jgi:predicted MPP superfamily phosphohydrolase